MNRKLLWIAFALAASAQLAVPASMIQRQQATLREGVAYRFRTAPVDPADPFRGRFVALDFEVACSTAPGPMNDPQNWQGRFYAQIAIGADGFAQIVGLTRAPPSQGDYLRVRGRGGCDHERVSLELPFDRYYLPEALAPRAEQAYLELNRQREATMGPPAPDGRVPGYASVRVRGGHAVLEELYLDGKPVVEYLDANPSKP